MSDNAKVRFGDKLVQVHNELRSWIRAIQEEIEEFLDERDKLDSGEKTVPTLAYQLRKNCLDFCHQLHGHHVTEDERFFPALEEQFPELRPQLERMRQEHTVVADLISRIRATVSEAGDGDAEKTKKELASLVALLEDHLDYEEKYIVEAMNDLPSTV